MLGTMREYSRSIIIYVLFGIIIVVFVFTFNVSGQSSGCGGGDSSAHAALVTIGDTDLDMSDLYMGLALSADPPRPGPRTDPRSFQAELVYRSTRFARLRGDPKYRAYIPDPTHVSMIKARKVMDDLEETWLVSELARAQGMRVGPKEARSRIVPEFTDSDGVFKKKRYGNWVRWGLKTTLGRFEDFIRREILREKMIALITANVTVTDREARMAAKLRKEKREYEYVEISPDLLAEAITPSADEIAAFLAADEDKVKKYFEDHKGDYQVEPAFDYHVAKFSAASTRIMATVKDPEQRKALESSWTGAKEKADKALGRIAGLTGDQLRAAFEQMAKELSDDSRTRDRGGRVSAPVSLSIMASLNPEVFAALSGLKPAQASGLVKADDGYYIVLLDGKIPGKKRDFEQVKDRVAARLIAEEKADETAKTEADTVLALALKDQTRPLTAVATEANVPFAPKSPIKYNSTGEIPAMPETISGLAEWSPTSIPGLGDSEELASALKKLTSDAPVAKKVFRIPGSKALYVVRLKSAVEAGEPDKTEIASALDDLLPIKRQAYYRDWYSSLRNREASTGRFVEHEALTALIQDEIRSLEESAKQAEKETRK
ncbi:MAG: hypothetical protein GXP54_01195 [Deltaproteobacteria bacterium]|nr:hypothetical protein [Deltaproteobacteria bacterium]